MDLAWGYGDHFGGNFFQFRYVSGAFFEGGNIFPYPYQTNKDEEYE